ncbi:50S ribosomal protein L9 [Terasakiispira papahanaumokuakeensis]|uniref:Large ribosomal subunit protein bL9 n=1 Tax=Terasakiispira papahanaumokuakeensis TaxID=197479 RepID=A0A1E2V663_9GAMM|nr:50S ribosomal protein L9 [Terasakiispira papahanaumokuakeensis]ODC02479.1 50S ribosomal protein L9 [Terasakiispira papahanaumokuakeensis]
MQVILLENIAKLGELGDVVNVKNGYGRNFLIPQGKAVRATEESKKAFEARRAELVAQAAERKAAAEARKAKMDEIEVVTIPARAGDEGKLFGSIGPRDLAEALTDNGFEIAKSEIRMPNGPLRAVGEYDITVHFHAEVEGALHVAVIADE